LHQERDSDDGSAVAATTGGSAEGSIRASEGIKMHIRSIVERSVDVTFFPVCIAGMLVIGGCSGRQPAPPVANHSASTAVAAASASVGEGPPSALTQIGESAEELFDAARASKWNDATAAVQTLNESAATLSDTGLKPDLVEQLQLHLADLAGSVKTRRRVHSMDVANSITRIVADLAAPYQAELPYKIVLLDYYGRQLELGLAASRLSMLKQATADLRQTWDSIEPSILRRGHVEDARRFTDIVVQIEGAKRPADFVAPVRAELAAVDRLEKIFTRS
jgi:hypothetical protein